MTITRIGFENVCVVIKLIKEVLYLSIDHPWTNQCQTHTDKIDVF